MATKKQKVQDPQPRKGNRTQPSAGTPAAARLMNYALLAEALRLRQLGWHIIPIGQDKKPLIPWKRWCAELPDEGIVRRWFGLPDVKGLAALHTNGRCCRDFDAEDGYRNWSEQHRHLAQTLPTVRTARGFHVWFACPEAKFRVLHDGELRIGDHYTLIPPSIHPTGVRYEWVVPLGEDGGLPVIDHRVFLPKESEPIGVSERLEKSECHGSGFSELSELSELSDTLSIEEVIAVTQPKKVGERDRKILELARGLRFNCALADQDFRDLKPLVARWYEIALPVIGTKEFTATWIAFVHAWPRAKRPLKDKLVELAFSRLREDDLPPEAAACADNQRMVKLMALCREMARLLGRRRFFLGSHKASRVLGVPQPRILELFEALIADRVLRLHKKGTPGVNGKANRYDYLGELPLPDQTARAA